MCHKGGRHGACILIVAFAFVSMMLVDVGYAACVTPIENLMVNSTSSTLCGGNYNLNDAGGDGAIIINDNNFTLDCNGSVIYGSYGGTSVGLIKSTGNGNNITLKNCTFYAYNTGISLNDVVNVTLEDSNFSSNQYNVYFSNINNSKILNTVISKSTTGYGVFLSNSKNITVRNNTITQSTQNGIYLSGTTDSWIDDNDVVDNGNADDSGIYLATSNNNNITNNEINDTNSVGFGINIFSGTGNILDSNYLYKTGAGITYGGIRIQSTQNIIINNIISDSDETGIKITASTNAIEGNTITGSTAYGIYADTADFLNISNNIIKDSTSHGIYLKTSNGGKVANNTIIGKSAGSGAGIQLETNVDNKNIYYNNITGNKNYGINCMRGSSNTIYSNFIRYNTPSDIILNNDCGVSSANNFTGNAITKAIVDSSAYTNTFSGNIIADFIVDNDTNPIRDHQNITGAVGAAEAGQSIFVYGGYYSESLILGKENMTLKGETKEGAYINCTNGDYAFRIEADNVTVENFTVSCGGSASYGFGVWFYNTSYSRLLSSIITGSNAGVALGDMSLAVSVAYNVVKSVLFESNVGGIYVLNENSVVSYSNITENNFSSTGYSDIALAGTSNANLVWKNNITSASNYFYESSNTYCVSGWDNWYNESSTVKPECMAAFGVSWNDTVIYVNDSVRLVANLTGQTELKGLNATVSWNGTGANYTMGYLSGDNITGQWFVDFSNTSYKGAYNVTDLYRLDADGDTGNYAVSPAKTFDTKILGISAATDKAQANVSDTILISANVTENATEVTNVTAIILKPDGYIEESKMTYRGVENGIHKYELAYTNTTRSGNYQFNLTVLAGNTETAYGGFFINYGIARIKLVSGSDVLLNGSNDTRVYKITASNGDLKEINATMYLNSSVLAFNNDNALKNISELLNGNEWAVSWNITAVGEGVSNSDAVAVPANGSYGYINKTVNVTLGSDLAPPVVKNVWVENGYTTYNLNENATIYANVSDNYGVKSATLNITHPDNFSEAIPGQKLETYDDGVVNFMFYATNISVLAGENEYLFYVNATDTSSNTNSSGTKNFSTTDEYSVNVQVYSIYNRGETVNATLDVRNINNLPVTGFSKTVNLTYPEGNATNSTILGNGTYYISPSNITGAYSIFANVSKSGNKGNGTGGFNVTNALAATFFTPSATFRPVPKQSLTLIFRISNARGDAYFASANYTGYCFITDTGIWGNETATKGTYTGPNITIAEECYATTTYSTPFNVTFDISDLANNNTGIYSGLWTTKDLGGGGGDTGTGTSPGISGSLPGFAPADKKTRDFEFSVKPATLSVVTGKKESASGIIDNKGDFYLSLDIDVTKECCNITAQKRIDVKSKNKVTFPIDVYANLTVGPNEYRVTVKASNGSLVKEDTFTVAVSENPLVSGLRDVSERIKGLEKDIEEYRKAGVDVSGLEARLKRIKDFESEAAAAIEKDSLQELATKIDSANKESILLSAELEKMKFLAWVSGNKEQLAAGGLSAIILFLFMTKFMLPYIWMKKELAALKKRERELTDVRKITEVQYFKRQIDEATFNRIMTEKHSALNETRNKINVLESDISLLKRGKFGSLSSKGKYTVTGKIRQNTGFLSSGIRRALGIKPKQKAPERKPPEEIVPAQQQPAPAMADKPGSLSKLMAGCHKALVRRKEKQIENEIKKLESKEKNLESAESELKKEITRLGIRKKELEESESQQ